MDKQKSGARITTTVSSKSNTRIAVTCLEKKNKNLFLKLNNSKQSLTSKYQKLEY